ncbi:MAG: hypothetical protein AAF958_10035 [Planctomycetota bacterium]
MTPTGPAAPISTPALTPVTTLASRRRHRRSIALAVTLVAFWVTATLNHRISSNLGRPAFFTGWILAVGLLLLVALGLRRRLPLARLGSMSLWLQVHLYVGIFMAAVYSLHVPRLIADGFLGRPLSITFLAVMVSGFYGLFVSRRYPRRLAALGQDYRCGDFAWYRRQLVEQAERAIPAELGNNAQHNDAQNVDTQHVDADVLGPMLQQRVRPFLAASPSWSFWLWPRRDRARRMMDSIRDSMRYLAPENHVVAETWISWIRQRDRLDYAWSLQTRLRAWVIVHAIASVLLIAQVIVHILNVYRYAGS